MRELLTTYGHFEKMGEAKAWYDGYRFGGCEIYNPWSLLNYVDDGFTPRPYWLDTSSNDLVADAISRMTPRRCEELADMFEKGERKVPCAVELGAAARSRATRRSSGRCSSIRDTSGT